MWDFTRVIRREVSRTSDDQGLKLSVISDHY